MEVKRVGFADDAAGLAEFEDAEAASGLEDAMEFAAAQLRSWRDCENRRR